MADEVIVVIGDDEVQVNKGSFTDENGKEVNYDTRKQPARIEADGYVYPGMIPLEKGREPYAPGRYVMRCDRMITVDQNKKIGWRKFPVLKPVAATTPK